MLKALYQLLASTLSIAPKPIEIDSQIHSILGDKFYSLPAETLDSWRQVLSDVPHGLYKLQQGYQRLNKTFNYITNCEKSSLRVNDPSGLGVDNTKQYSGYYDFGKNHLFYYAFESRNDPENDPVVLWLNGGPGCSSLTGLFFELGPSKVLQDLSLERNEFSWNTNATIIFVDQPVNVGLSYSDDLEEPHNSVVAEHAMADFLETFFFKFPKFQKNDFYVAGESYAGHYVPALASELLERNFKTLQGILIGNGLTDPLVQYTSYQDMACGVNSGYPSVLSPKECAQLRDDTPICLQLIEKCYKDQSDVSCLPATVYCNNKVFQPYLETGYNFYDVRQQCNGQPCYPDEGFSGEFISKKRVYEALGASKDNVPKFRECNNKINSEFVNDGDWMRPYMHNVTKLLDAGKQVLVYAGDADYSVNWIGNERWAKKVDWKHQDKFENSELVKWGSSGEIRRYENLAFARVYGGGHMLPHDQPESSLNLFNWWIQGGEREELPI